MVIYTNYNYLNTGEALYCETSGSRCCHTASKMNPTDWKGVRGVNQEMRQEYYIEEKAEKVELRETVRERSVRKEQLTEC